MPPMPTFPVGVRRDSFTSCGGPGVATQGGINVFENVPIAVQKQKFCEQLQQMIQEAKTLIGAPSDAEYEVHIKIFYGSPLYAGGPTQIQLGRWNVPEDVLTINIRPDNPWTTWDGEVIVGEDGSVGDGPLPERWTNANGDVIDKNSLENILKNLPGGSGLYLVEHESGTNNGNKWSIMSIDQPGQPIDNFNTLRDFYEYLTTPDPTTGIPPYDGPAIGTFTQDLKTNKHVLTTTGELGQSNIDSLDLPGGPNKPVILIENFGCDNDTVTEGTLTQVFNILQEYMKKADIAKRLEKSLGLNKANLMEWINGRPFSGRGEHFGRIPFIMICEVGIVIKQGDRHNMCRGFLTPGKPEIQIVTGVTTRPVVIIK